MSHQELLSAIREKKAQTFSELNRIRSDERKVVKAMSSPSSQPPPAKKAANKSPRKK
jgi:hypothetical protein